MAELVATEVLKPLLGKLAKLLSNEFNLLTGVRDNLEFLQRELSAMDALLREVKLGQRKNYWIMKLKEMAYDIEDGIDAFLVHLGSGNQNDGLIRDFIKHPNLKERHGIAKQLEELRSLIEEESKRRMQYSFEGSTAVADQMATDENIADRKREAALFVDPGSDELVGMNGPVEKVVKLMTLDEDDAAAHQLQILSIQGAGGLGKTTLAHQVHQKIQGQFDYTAKVSVSQRASLENIDEILIQIAPQVGTSGAKMNKWQLTDNVKNYLRDKRYLIIFDDIWDSEIWEALNSALPKNDRKSRVITTTRIIEVAESCCPESYHIHKMDPLSADNSKKLFIKRTFRSKKRSCPKHLNELANQILKKCGGIPLAIITIAGLLAQDPGNKSKWKEVQNSLGNNNAHDLKGMNTILSLSFHDLPYDLRNCFLYLSIFPEDYEISRERLVLRWISEGFILGTEGNQKQLKQKGEEYFNELVNRSLIQPIDIQYNGLPLACRVHDLILSLIVSIAKEENFVTVLDKKECSSAWNNKIRWFSVHSDKYEGKVITDNRSYVRSISFFPPVKQLPPMSDFQALRILDVKGCHFVEYQTLKYLMRSLLQLKYLDLSDTNIEELPKEIAYLQCLETLDLRNSPIKSLPSTLVQLQKLVRLFVNPGVPLPERIGEMQALEEISHVAILCNSLKFVEQLGSLINLRALQLDYRLSWGNKQGVRDLDISNMDAVLLSSLSKLGQSLNSLKVDLAYDSLVFSLLDSSCALPQLKELIISNFISRVPECMRSLEDLSYLDIKLEEMEAGDLDILSEMSASLEFLRLHLSASPEERLVIDAEGFMCLKHFEFCCDDGGMGLEFAEEAMPELKRLDLEIGVRNTMSKYDDFEFGIKNLKALMHVTVKLDCNFAEGREIKAAETAITSGVCARRIVPQIQKIGI